VIPHYVEYFLPKKARVTISLTLLKQLYLNPTKISESNRIQWISQNI